MRVSELLYCPQIITSPRDLDQVRRSTDGWLELYGLLRDEKVRRRYLAIDAPGLANYACPDSALDRRVYIGKWSAWLFLLDDICDEDGVGETPERVEAFLKTLIQNYHFPYDETDPTPLGVSLRSLSRDIRAMESDDYVERFGGVLWNYFKALLWEDGNRLRGIPPSLSEYTAMRREAGAIYLMFGLIEVSSQVRLPFPVLDSEPMLTAIEHAASAIGWSNDLLSLEREMAAEDLHNVVIVLEHEENLSRSQAVAKAAELHNERVRAFLELQRSLTDSSSREVGIYLQALWNWVKGFYDWALTTARYDDFSMTAECSSRSARSAAAG